MKSLWDSVLWLRRKNKQDKEEILTAVNAVQNLFKTSGETTATASDIVAPKTAYNGTTLITGTIADKTGTSEYAATASIDNTNKKIKMQVPAAGKYGTKNYLYQSFSNIASLIGLTASKLVKNNTVLGITGNSSNMDTSGCDAAAAQILSGKKAGVKGNVVTGTMVNRAGTTVQAAAVTQDDDNTYFAVPEAAYYDKNSKIATANSNLGNVNVPNGMYLAVTGGLSFTLESKGISKEIISHLKFVAGYVGDFSGRNEDYGLSQYRHYGAIVKYENGIVTANPSNGYAAVMGSAGGSSSGWTRFNSVCAVFQYI